MRTKQLNPTDLTPRIPVEQSQNITREKLKALLPRGSSTSITDEVLQLINDMGESVDLDQNALEEDVMSYIHLLGKTKNSLKELINAIKYCNLKRHYNNQKAWSIVFPDKYDKVKVLGGHIDNHVSMYNKGKLIQAIDKEMIIPVYLQYSGYHHKAISELYKVGVLNNAGLSANGDKMTVSPMVKVQALKELVAATKAPEETKIDIAIGLDDVARSAQDRLSTQLEKMLNQQMKGLEAGKSVEEIQVIGLNPDDVLEAELDE